MDFSPFWTSCFILVLFLWEPPLRKRWSGSGIRTRAQTVLFLPISLSTGKGPGAGWSRVGLSLLFLSISLNTVPGGSGRGSGDSPAYISMQLLNLWVVSGRKSLETSRQQVKDFWMHSCRKENWKASSSWVWGVSGIARLLHRRLHWSLGSEYTAHTLCTVHHQYCHHTTQHWTLSTTPLLRFEAVVYFVLYCSVFITRTKCSALGETWWFNYEKLTFSTFLLWFLSF